MYTYVYLCEEKAPDFARRLTSSSLIKYAAATDTTSLTRNGSETTANDFASDTFATAAYTAAPMTWSIRSPAKPSVSAR